MANTGMAIVCTPTITVLNAADKRVSISCNIAVDAKPEIAVALAEADISTPEKKIEVANILWQKFQVKYAQQTAEANIAAEITSLESALKANIEGRVL